MYHVPARALGVVAFGGGGGGLRCAEEGCSCPLAEGSSMPTWPAELKNHGI